MQIAELDCPGLHCPTVKKVELPGRVLEYCDTTLVGNHISVARHTKHIYQKVTQCKNLYESHHCTRLCLLQNLGNRLEAKSGHIQFIALHIGQHTVHPANCGIRSTLIHILLDHDEHCDAQSLKRAADHVLAMVHFDDFARADPSMASVCDLRTRDRVHVRGGWQAMVRVRDG